MNQKKPHVPEEGVGLEGCLSSLFLETAEVFEDGVELLLGVVFVVG
jgi:hypothetical protein